MAIESYADLQASMQKYLKRQDLAALLPDFITLAEEYFNDNVFTRARRVSYVITPMQYTVPLPSDWERVADVWYDTRQLDFRGPGSDTAYSGANNNPAAYGIYQIIGNTLAFSARAAQLGAKLQIDYFPTLEPLSDTNVSNWLLEDSPSTYLYGALKEAAIYIRDDARLQLWQSLRDQAIQSKIDADTAAKTPMDGPLQIVAG
jgi:hypothetical protein